MVPQVASIHEADVLMQGLGSLSPRRLYALLTDCRNVKVKRQALWFADRTPTPGLNALSADRSSAAVAIAC